MSTNLPLHAWLEIDGRALRENLRAIRQRLDPRVRVIPMVKANAYGLGMLEVVRALRPEGPWGWGVATIGEGVALRDADVDEPVVVFSPLTPDEYPIAVEQGLSVAVSSIEALSLLAGAARSTSMYASFHVELDTGMGRAGCDPATLGDWIEPLREAAQEGLLRWEGLFTHFHSADEVGGPGVVTQLERFEAAVAEFDGAGLQPELVHVSNSAAALRLPERCYDAVRPGIFLYGGSIGADLPTPRAVASLKSRITLIRDVSAGASLGYGSTYHATGDERWATVGIGYADGLSRLLSNRGAALVGGVEVPIIGRISMDVTVVDISGVPDAQVGDPVTFFGSDGEASLSVTEVAATAGTIDYELLTGITGRVPRVWTHE